MKSEVIVPFEDPNYFMNSQHLDENLFQILGKDLECLFALNASQYSLNVFSRKYNILLESIGLINFFFSSKLTIKEL